MDAGVVTVFIPIVAIIGGISVAIASILAKSKIRQLEIRERIAMIERGWCRRPRWIPMPSNGT